MEEGARDRETIVAAHSLTRYWPAILCFVVRTSHIFYYYSRAIVNYYNRESLKKTRLIKSNFLFSDVNKARKSNDEGETNSGSLAIA